MSKRMLHCFPVAIAITTALALSGCGGGSNTRTDTGTGMTGDTGTGMTGDTGTGMTDDPTLTVRDGLAQSAATPVHAGSANDTLATLLPDATNQFAPLTSTLRRDWGESTTAPANDSHIKTIASDGSNGFHVTYVVGGEERMIHFAEADYVAEDYNFYTEVDGDGYWLWSYTDSYHGADKNQGSSRYTYVDLSGASDYHEDDDDAEDEGASNLSYFSYGARTDAANLPTGSATYAGIVDADTYLRSNPSRTHREDMKGNLRLTANFDGSTLDGMIFGIRVRTRNQNDDGWNEWTALSDTTNFEMSDGQIVDGQFSATLTGVDSNAAAPADETVRGYEGGILGEFYGPAAEEVGGVLNASRNDRVMQGVFAGKQGDADAPSSATGLNRSMASPVYAVNTDHIGDLFDQGSRFAPLSSVLRRDWYELSTAPANDSHIKTIASDGNNGFHVTYVVVGDERMIHFEEADYVAEDYNFYTEVDGVEYWLWSYTGAFDGTDKNQGSSRYTYVDLSGFSSSHEGVNDQSRLSYGARTDAANLPAGSATYTGIVSADTYLVDDPNRIQSEGMRANLRLAANFDDSTLDGMIFGIRVRTRGENGWNEWSALSDTTHFEIGDGEIADGQFSATLTGVDSNAAAPSDETVRGYEGGILGEFYGPAAEEVGGVFNASRTDRVIQGVFAGKQGDADAPSSTPGLNRSMESPVYATNTDDLGDLWDLGSRFAPLSSALRRDWYEVSTTRDDDAYVKRTWGEGNFGDGTGKLYVTYVVDGEEQTVNFEAADSDSQDGFEKEVDGVGAWLWSLTDSFASNSGYTYLDVWGFGHYGDISHRYFASFGARTEAANLPTGSATYVGRIRADSYKQYDPSSNFRDRVDGDLNLTANFDGGTLEGTVTAAHWKGPCRKFARGGRTMPTGRPCPQPPLSR